MRILAVALCLGVLTACGLVEGEQAAVTIGVEPVIVVASKTPDAPNGQLPATPFPVAYDLNMVLDPRENGFSGWVEMTVRFTESATGFYLHGQDLNIGSVKAGPSLDDLQDATWTDILPSGVARIEFAEAIEPGDMVVVISYDALFDANLAGMFKVTEQGDAYALAKSESIQARRFMPGFDQPAFKAPFDVTLFIPEDYVAITNTREITRVRTGTGIERVEFETTRPLPTYLLSLAVGPFDVVEAPDIPANSVRSMPIPLTGYARRGKGEELAYALETAAQLIEIFELELRYPYPYDKLDIIAAPQWPSGATELAAAITYRESRILSGPNIGPAARRGLLGIHSHELGHSWFGNLVTPPWWDDLWLKEAFASWGQGVTLSQLEPEGGYELDAIANGIRAMGLDSLGAARAVREPILINENIRNAYDAITYNKGQAVIGMVDAYFGADVFRPALGMYIAAHEDGVADSPQFFDTISEVIGDPELVDTFQSFVEQSGLPLVRVTTAPQNGSGYIAEPVFEVSRYAPLGSAIDPARVWTVPFCFKYGQSSEIYEHCELLEPVAEAQRMDGLQRFEHDWIMPNAGGTGYWRFSMPSEMWQALGQAFHQLEPGEQMAVLDSVGAEFAAGRIDIGTVWNFIDEATRVEERRVVAAAIIQAMRFEQHVENDAVALAGYRAALIDVFEARLIALEQVGGDSENAQILKNQLEQLMVRTAHDPVRRKLLADAAGAMIGLLGAVSDRELSSDDFTTAFAVAIQDTGQAFLDRALMVRTQIDDPVFEQALAFAIGQNDDPALSAKVLAMALSGELGSRESLTIVAGQMAQPNVRDLTWDWLQENYATYVEVIPRQRRRATPGHANGLCSDAQLGQLQALFDAHGDLAPGFERPLALTRELITNCQALEAEKGAEVRAFFTPH